MSLEQWVSNLALRLAQLERISQCKTFAETSVWLGGLFFPEAYVTATRQAAAQKNGWSLEQLELCVRPGIDEAGAGAFLVDGE